MAKIKVLIVEDEPIIAQNIKAILQHVNYTVVGIAYNKEQAINFLQNTKPDIALLDINLGNNTDGIKIAEYIIQHNQIPFLYLTSYSNKIILDKVKHTLPMGYIVKPFDEADIYTSIEIALSNFKGIKKTLSIKIINKKLPVKLTRTEFEILKEIYQGKSNSIISENNFVSVNTIKTHIKNIYEKLNVNSRPEAIVKIRNLLES